MLNEYKKIQAIKDNTELKKEFLENLKIKFDIYFKIYVPKFFTYDKFTRIFKEEFGFCLLTYKKDSNQSFEDYFKQNLDLKIECNILKHQTMVNETLSKTKQNDIDLFTAYMSEVEQYLILTIPEEKYWFSRSDEEAKEKIINSNLKLVVSIAKRFKKYSTLPLLDLIQEGNFGLFDALKNFDVSRGYKFSTYATDWIRMRISRANDADRLIRLPSNIIEDKKKINSMIKKLSTNKEEPTCETLAQELDWSLEKVNNLKEHSLPILSLDKNVKDEEDLKYFIKEENEMIEQVILSLLREDLDSTLKRMLYDKKDILDHDKKYKILKMRFGLDTGEALTLEAIGQVYGITKEAVRLNINKAFKILKMTKEIEKYAIYMDDPDKILTDLKEYRLENVKKKIKK